MSDPEFSIRTSDLDAAGRDYDLPVRQVWIRSVLEDCEASAGEQDGRLQVRASKSGPEVVVHGSLEAQLTVPCARCLDPVKVAIKSELSVIYVPKSKLKAEGSDADGDITEADTLGYDGDEVVLDELVRDELLLEIPMIPLCSDDCPGMSPAPGIQEAAPSGIDPRLAPLLAFQGEFLSKKKD